jgi:ribonuclease P protein component
VPAHTSGSGAGTRGRLSRAAEFDAVAQLGRSTGGRYLTLRYRERDREELSFEGPRVGYAVPRKVGTAVDRNQLKRRLKAAVDTHEAKLRERTDYVVIARPGLAAAADAQDFAWLCSQIGDVLDAAAAA